MTDDQKMFVPITQDEANYVELSPNLGAGQACATCRFFNAPNYCSLIENMPKPIQNTGYCDRFEEGVGMDAQTMHEELVEELAGEIVEAFSEYGMGEMSANNSGDSRAEKDAPGIRGALKSIFNFWRTDGELPAFKALGNGYWFASYTNNFEDVEKEILSMDAHDRYYARAQSGLVPMPELWFMHTKGTKHGDALYVWRQGHVGMAVGKFDDSEFGAAMEKYYQKSKPDDIKLSHGFLYPLKWGKKKVGDLYIYEDYNTYEITTLPRKWARPANPYTNSFLAVQEIKAMPMNENTRNALLEATGNEKLVKRIEDLANNAEALGEKVAEVGVTMKAFDDLLPDNKDKQKDAATDVSIDASVLEAVLMGQEAQQKSLDDLITMFGQVPAVMKAYEAQIADLKKAVKEKDAALNQTPRSVAAGNAEETDVEDSASTQAQDDIEKQVQDDIKKRQDGSKSAAETLIGKLDRQFANTKG